MQVNNDPFGVLKSDKHLQPPNIVEYKGPTCCVCGDTLKLTNLNSDYVCIDCQREYISKNADDFIQPYINENQKSYYLNWWFDNLQNQDKLDIVSKAYLDRKTIEQMADFKDLALDRVNFCLDSDDFYEYVKSKLE